MIDRVLLVQTGITGLFPSMLKASKISVAVRVPDYSQYRTEKWGSSGYQNTAESLPPRHITPCSCSPLFISRIRGMEKLISFPNPSRTKPRIKRRPGNIASLRTYLEN